MSTTERPPPTAHDWPLIQAAKLVVEKQHCTRRTTSRELRRGWAATGRILDELQRLDVVGPDQGDEAGTRKVLAEPGELDDVLEHLRANAKHLTVGEPGEKDAHNGAHNSLVADTEALDDRHGGDKVLRGRLGVAEVHADEPGELEIPQAGKSNADDEPGTELEIRPTSEVVDAELVPKPEPEPVALIGTIVQEGPAAALAVLRETPQVQTVETVARPPLRMIWTMGVGLVSGTRRAWSAATFGLAREQVRTARALGDSAAVSLARAELREEKKARTARRKEQLDNVRGWAWIAGRVLLGLVVAIVVGAIIVGLRPGGLTWTDWWAGLLSTFDAIGAVLYWLWTWKWWLLAPPAVVLAYREGLRAGWMPDLLLPPEEREQEDVAVTPAKVVLALRDLGIPKLRDAIRDAADGAGQMLGTISGAGPGVEVDALLPSGVSTSEVRKRREKLAQNLDRHPHELFISIPPRPRTVRLWIADPGALDEPVGPSPLVLDETLRADVRTGRCPWGNNLRNDAVGISVHQRHLTITGLSNQGKTAALRALALWAALDPNTELWIADLKGVGDWAMFDGLAERLIQGPTDSHVAAATEMLEEAGEEMKRRTLEGKGGKWRRLIVIVDEAQVAFMCPEKDEQGRPYGGTKATSRYFRAAREIHNQGRAVDVTLWQGTQDPTDQNFPKIVREGAHIRASLVVGTESQARMALGDAAVDRGAAPHELRPDLDRGMLVVHGGVDLAPGQASVTVRTHYIDDEAAVTVAERAKAIRKRRRRGHLAAVEAAPPKVDHLARIGAALRGEKRVLTTTVLARLIEDDPDEYEGRDLSWLSTVLDREGCPAIKSGRMYVDAERVRRALENPSRGVS